MLCEKLKEEYLNKLEVIIADFKAKSVKLSEEGAKDEAILETIKANVVDIFYKMFNASYNKACKGNESEEVKAKNLLEAYLNFFEKIPASWKEKMEKDKAHNMMEEYYKEVIKLETKDYIRGIFIEDFNRLCKE